jgi:hypothetical protein
MLKGSFQQLADFSDYCRSRSKKKKKQGCCTSAVCGLLEEDKL